MRETLEDIPGGGVSERDGGAGRGSRRGRREKDWATDQDGVDKNRDRERITDEKSGTGIGTFESMFGKSRSGVGEWALDAIVRTELLGLSFETGD